MNIRKKQENYSFRYSCLENLMDGGAWKAAVHGVAQSRTRLKWLSSSSREKKVKLMEAQWFICHCRRCRFDPLVWKIPWRRKWQSTPVFLPGKFHGQRSLVGYSPRGRRVRHDWATSHTLSFTSEHDYWKNHSFDYMELCWQSDFSAFEYAV